MTVHGMDNGLNVHAEGMQVLSEYDMIELMAEQKLSGVYSKTVTVKEEDHTRKTDGKRQPSKKEASIGRRENRNYVIGTKKADAAGLAETISAITHSGKTRG